MTQDGLGPVSLEVWKLLLIPALIFCLMLVCEQGLRIWDRAKAAKRRNKYVY